MTLHVEHVGLEADFDHPKGRNLALSGDTAHAFEQDREHADIFTQVSTGALFSTTDMLNWFLLQSDSQLEDHLAATAGASNRPVLLTIPIRFGPEPFTMETVDGVVALRGLKLLLRIRGFKAPVHH